MSQKMLRGIRDRAERLAAAQTQVLNPPGAYVSETAQGSIQE
jgi:hypothetical protein